MLQAGSRVAIAYRARHADQLGAATLEAAGGSPDLLDDPLGLLGLQCACVMTQKVLPEREPHTGAYHGLSALLGAFAIPDIWPAIYVRYEAGLLEELGFGLDLAACAVTGGHDQLVYVSPKSGRAVSREAGRKDGQADRINERKRQETISGGEERTDRPALHRARRVSDPDGCLMKKTPLPSIICDWCGKEYQHVKDHNGRCPKAPKKAGK